MDKIKEENLISLRRKIHKYPEPGWCEYKTAALVIKELQNLKYKVLYGEELSKKDTKLGLEPKDISDMFFARAEEDESIDRDILEKIKDSNTAVIGILECSKGPTRLFRFDMDALKLEETNTDNHLPYKEGFTSENKNYMHACGHDAHTAIGIFVARELAQLKNEITGRIILLFQPAEEGLRGAESLLHHSIFSEIDYGYGFHLWSHMKTGKIICATNGQLSSTKFNLKIYGKASHAGLNPEEGINALQCAGEVIYKLYQVYNSYKNKVKFNIGKIKGGESRNIICPFVELELETRADDSIKDENFYRKCTRIIEDITIKHKCEYEIITKGYAESANSDESLAAEVKDAACKIPFFDDIVDQEQAKGNSEDFTNIMREIQRNNKQATYIGIGASLNAGGHHTSDFDINEKCLAPVVDLIKQICLNK